nr:hypothetical protein [Shewanella ferrihydritica]
MALSLSTSFLPTQAAAAATRTTLRSLVPSQRMRCSMRKKGLHPEIYEDAKVYCNGERCSMRKKGLHPEIYEDAKVYCN